MENDLAEESKSKQFLNLSQTNCSLTTKMEEKQLHLMPNEGNVDIVKDEDAIEIDVENEAMKNDEDKILTLKIPYEYSYLIPKHITELQEDQVIKSEIQSNLIATCLQDENLLLNKKLEKLHEKQKKILEEKETVKNDLFSKNIWYIELENEINSAGEIVKVVVGHFLELQKLSNNSAEKFHALQKKEINLLKERNQFNRDCLKKAAAMQKNYQQETNNVNIENQQLVYKFKNFEDEANNVNLRFENNEEIYTTLQEKYEFELRKNKELNERMQLKKEEIQNIKNATAAIDLEDLARVEEKMEAEMKLKLEEKKKIAEEVQCSLQKILEENDEKKKEIERILVDIVEYDKAIEYEDMEINEYKNKIEECDIKTDEIPANFEETVHQLENDVEEVQNKIIAVKKNMEDAKKIQENYKVEIIQHQEKLKVLDEETQKKLETKESLIKNIEDSVGEIMNLRKNQVRLQEELAKKKIMLLSLKNDELKAINDKKQVQNELNNTTDKYNKIIEEKKTIISEIKASLTLHTSNIESLSEERKKKLLAYDEEKDDIKMKINIGLRKKCKIKEMVKKETRKLKDIKNTIEMIQFQSKVMETDKKNKKTPSTSNSSILKKGNDNEPIAPKKVKFSSDPTEEH